MKSLGVVLLAAGLLSTTPLKAAETAADVIKAFGLREDAKPLREVKGWIKPKKIAVIIDSPERLAWIQEEVKGVTLVIGRGMAAVLVGGLSPGGGTLVF